MFFCGMDWYNKFEFIDDFERKYVIFVIELNFIIMDCVYNVELV